MLAPARANWRAIPLPTPLLAPVTRAVFELSGRVTLAILSGGKGEDRGYGLIRRVFPSDRGRCKKLDNHRMRPVCGRRQLRLIERGDEEAAGGALHRPPFSPLGPRPHAKARVLEHRSMKRHHFVV